MIFKEVLLLLLVPLVNNFFPGVEEVASVDSVLILPSGSRFLGVALAASVHLAPAALVEPKHVHEGATMNQKENTLEHTIQTPQV